MMIGATRRSLVALLLLFAGCQPAAESDTSNLPKPSLKANTDPPRTDGLERSSEQEQLPVGWRKTSVIDVDPLQARQIGQKLGGRISQLKNVVYSVDGERVQLNTIRCPEEGAARRVASALLKIHGGIHAKCVRHGTTVYEFVCQDLRLVERAYRELGIPASTVTYEVAFQVAPLSRSEPMLWNRFFNACLAKDESSLEKLLPSFAFGDSLSVRNFGQGSKKSKYTFEPDGVALPREDDGKVKAYRFVDLPVTFGVPRVGVQVQVSSTGFGVSKIKAGDGELVDETAYWPCNDDKISQLAREITADTEQALLNWFASGQNIRFDGTVVGSRYGVPKVLKQGFGHCWDYSDLFITLARSAGIPCRQVYGWLYGQSGHVWVEVLTPEGWRAVDPTAGMGCDSRYIPLFTSENGTVDFVYTSMPRIKLVEGR